MHWPERSRVAAEARAVLSLVAYPLIGCAIVAQGSTDYWNIVAAHAQAATIICATPVPTISSS
jgi:hypothetical protein